MIGIPPQSVHENIYVLSHHLQCHHHLRGSEFLLAIGPQLPLPLPIKEILSCCASLPHSLGYVYLIAQTCVCALAAKEAGQLSV